MKYLILSSILILSLSCICLAQNNNETFTITTYYPAPYGVYRDMQINRGIRFNPINITTGIDPANLTDGLLVYNQSDKQFYFYATPSGGGSGTWKKFSDSGDAPLLKSQHTQNDCIAANGTIVSIPGITYPLCRFNKADCPTGWFQHDQWSTTKTVSGTFSLGAYQCTGSSPGTPGQPCGACTTTTQNVNGHTWSNMGIEDRKYYSYSHPDPMVTQCCVLISGPPTYNGCYFTTSSYYHGGIIGNTVSAIRTQIGCY